MPVLVIWGQEDLRPGVGVEMAKAIPHAQLVTVQNAGHHRRDQPDRTCPGDENLLSEWCGFSATHRATIPADRSMSAAQSPGIDSIAVIAWATSVSVTMRPSAARETKARSASA